MLYVLCMLILCVKYQDLMFKTHLGKWKSSAFFIPDIIVTLLDKRNLPHDICLPGVILTSLS